MTTLFGYNINIIQLQLATSSTFVSLIICLQMPAQSSSLYYANIMHNLHTTLCHGVSKPIHVILIESGVDNAPRVI